MREATRWPGIRRKTTKDGRTVYESRLRGPDGRQVSRTFHRLEDARTWLTGMKADANRPAGWRDPRLEKVTVERWLTGPQWVKHQAGLRPKTREIYLRATDRAINGLGTVTLPQLSKQAVEGFRDGLLAAGHNPGGANQTLRVLTTALGLAVDAGILSKNPASRVRATDSVRPEDRPERRALTADEAIRLLEATPTKWKACVATSLTLGLRWSELAGLERADIDLEAGEVRVERQKYWLHGAVIVSAPKSRSGVRKLPIPDSLRPFLTRHLDEFAQPGANGIVFPSSSGRVMEGSLFRTTVWNQAIERAGIRHIVFHGLRITSTTWLLDAGASLKTVSAMAGHSSPTVTLNVYSRASVAAQKLASQAMSDVFQSALDLSSNVVSIQSKKRPQSDGVRAFRGLETTLQSGS